MLKGMRRKRGALSEDTGEGGCCCGQDCIATTAAATVVYGIQECHLAAMVLSGRRCLRCEGQ